MDELALQFFPYPHLINGKRRDGVVMAWPDRCDGCDRQCEAAKPGQLQLCSYGLNYQRVDEDLLIAGLMVSDFPTETQARRKMRAKLRESAITTEVLQKVVGRCKESATDLEMERQRLLDEVVAEYRESKGYQKDILKALKPELEQTLAQVHDYKQFVQQIVQNIDVLLEKRYPDMPLEEKLDKAEHEETAIYWAAVVMDEKLDAALFLESPERIYEKREQGRSRLHGMVLKYVRIYKRLADRKRLQVSVIGDSWGEIEGNRRALGIIPHTLIDNAIKYAPEGSKIEILFAEDQERIDLSVSSYGPRIGEDETARIFDVFYRGHAARRKLKEGTGFGLASAQNIAKAHDTVIEVDQDQVGNSAGYYWTRFSVEFKRAKIAAPEGKGGSAARRGYGK